MIYFKDCPHCDTPYSDERDENGLPFCECDGARLEKAEALIEYYKAKTMRQESQIRAYQEAYLLLRGGLMKLKDIVYQLFSDYIGAMPSVDEIKVELQRVREENNNGNSNDRN